jgi:predicted lipid-binding transport protein (Tim44 family)
MSEGFAYLDILFFAMVAAFVALRLRSVLGRRTGNERRRTPPPAAADGDNVVSLPDRGKAGPTEDAGVADISDATIKTGLAEIRAADPRFEVQPFLQGAKSAFALIVDAFATGDKEALKPLLASQVYENFSRSIDARLRKGQSLDTQLVEVRNAEVSRAKLDGRVARVEVRFTSEQVNTLREASGAVLPEYSHAAEEVVDLWTFERDLRTRDPNWTLVETRSPDPA